MKLNTIAAVALCLSLVLAGCSMSDTEPQKTTTESPTPTTTIEPRPTTTTEPTTRMPADTLLVRATGDGTFTVTITVVTADNDGVRVTYADGSAETFPGVESRNDLPVSALDDALRVAPVSGGSEGSFTTDNGAAGAAFGWPGNLSTLLYSVADGEGRLLGWGVFDCTGVITSVDLTIAETGVSGGRACSG
jgi:ABC-type glycerol-3-phosphate transport system substrate-binding protein